MGKQARVTGKKALAGLERISNHALGSFRNAIGKEREKAALNALRYNQDGFLPEWILAVALGTREEDRAGIDIVIHTDIGKMFLQIKSSRRQVEKFLSKHRKGNIVPFIVDQISDVLVLRGKLVACLENERSRILKLRSHA